MKPLLTPWGEILDRTRPLKDYPRPQMRRAQWQCLNGVWEYAITDGAAPKAWDGEIVVPFSPECALSGVGRQLLPGQTLWCHRTVSFDAPKDGSRLLLHFGAVDQHCVVSCNGHVVGEHSGGYWPFSFDITDHVKPGENVLTISVTDDTDTGDEAYGKQKLQRGGIWYTGQSGIWQTVWCEWVPDVYIGALRITPQYDDGTVEVAVSGGDGAPLPGGTVRVLAEGTPVAEAAITGGKAHISLPDFRSWSPDDPFLYDLDIRCGQDHVESYFGMRSFGMAAGCDGLPRPTLNGEPILHVGLLDQGYWSDGMYTPPSDDAMVWELEQVKRMGFNMLRKHIKIEPLRWYYHCDRLGIMVWQDFVSGGGPYKEFVIRHAPWLGLNFGDGPGRYALHGRGSAQGRDNFMRDMDRTMDLLHNVVSLAVWVPFNEGWGQFEAAMVARQVKQRDGTRLVDHASGYFDQGAGDFHSYHIYYKRFRPKADRHGRVLSLTEFGGYSLTAEGHMASETEFGYKLFRDKASYEQALTRLFDLDVFPMMRKGLGATVYTQVSDVEEEINGLFTYDRKVVKVDEAFVRGINDALHKAFRDAL